MYRYAMSVQVNNPSLDILHIAVPSKNEPLVLFLVRIPKLGRLRIQRTRTAHISILPAAILRRNSLVRLAQQTLQTKQHALHVIDRTPLVLQDIQTDPA